MGGAIRHHGIAVADAAGDVAIAGQRSGGLLRTECIERCLILVAGHGTHLIGRTGLPHPPDLQAGTPGFAPWSGRSGFAAGAHRALRALRTLQSRNAGFAAGPGRSLRPGRALEPLWSGGARRPWPAAACAGFAMKPGFVMAALRVLEG